MSTGSEDAPTRRLPPVAIERIVVVAVVLAVVVELARVGAGVSGPELAGSWQLLDREVLAHDLLPGIWYLHTQPPLHNLVVGLALVSPLPAEGTLFVLYAGCLVGIGLIVHDLARRWGAPGPVAVVVAGLAVADPPLLGTIRAVSYEVPVALMVVGLVALVDRHVAAPRDRLVLAIAGLGTAIVLTRALFHPVWLAMVLLVVLLARPVGRRMLIAAIVGPLLLVGGVVAKNAATVGSASLSSWTGFNLQRGVVGPMRNDTVVDAVASGAVSDLARQQPWLDLAKYDRWIGDCRPSVGNPAMAAPTKETGRITAPNFNAECYQPLYDQAQSDAIALIRRNPGRYLATRLPALALSFGYTPLGTDDPPLSLMGDRSPATSWMDRVYRPLMLLDRTTIGMDDWNIPLFGTTLTVELSWTLVVCCAIVLGRTVLALVRLIRAVVGRRAWPGDEVVWLVAGGTVAFVVLGGDLVELGENGRFRAMLDPLVVVLVMRAVVEVVRDVRRYRLAR